jgi:hypothetical protein
MRYKIYNVIEMKGKMKSALRIAHAFPEEK